LKNTMTGIIKKSILFIMLCLFKATIGLYVRVRYRLVSKCNAALPQKGAFLILGNHTNNFDGLFLQCLSPRLIRFVVTDTVFRHKALSRILHFAGYIPIRKHTSDSRAIRQIMHLVSQGSAIGIFPEGMRSWDGKTRPFENATFRLIQVLRIPVYAVRFKGAYLSEPRWADTKRHGLIEAEVFKLFDIGDKPSLKQIHQTVSDALEHDEGDWQRIRHIPFKGKALCAGFERLLFVCPACLRIGAMDSSSDRIWCLSCGAENRLDIYGFFHPAGCGPARSASELNAWQQDEMKRQFALKASHDVLLSDEGARLFFAETHNAPYTLAESGTITLCSGSLHVGRHAFRTKELSGISVGFKSHVEFRYHKKDYRINFEENRVSAYKWSCALAFAKHTDI